MKYSITSRKSPGKKELSFENRSIAVYRYPANEPPPNSGEGASRYVRGICAHHLS